MGARDWRRTGARRRFGAAMGASWAQFGVQLEFAVKLAFAVHLFVCSGGRLCCFCWALHTRCVLVRVRVGLMQTLHCRAQRALALALVCS